MIELEPVPVPQSSEESLSNAMEETILRTQEPFSEAYCDWLTLKVRMSEFNTVMLPPWHYDEILTVREEMEERVMACLPQI